MIGRREFIAGLGSAAAWPLAARAQQSMLPVIGYLGSRSPASDAQFVAAFRQGLSETGYAEGRNVTLEFRWADSQLDQLPKLAAELVRRQVAIIVTTGGAPAALAAKAATTTIPIVFTTGADPVARGLVRNLNRPGENLTGLTVFSTPVGQKRLQLLGDAVPQASVIAVLANPDGSGVEQINDLKAAASTLKRSLRMLLARTTAEIDAAFATITQERIRALFISSDSLFINRLDQIVALTARQSVPAVHELRDFATAGGLMSYGTIYRDNFRQLGVYAGRILNGEKPADLPVMLPTKFELVINLKAAKALGLTIPETLLATADEVIQ